MTSPDDPSPEVPQALRLLPATCYCRPRFHPRCGLESRSSEHVLLQALNYVRQDPANSSLFLPLDLKMISAKVGRPPPAPAWHAAIRRQEARLKLWGHLAETACAARNT